MELASCATMRVTKDKSMGKSYKKNDRHFPKGGKTVTKPNKHGDDRRIKFDKIKQILRPSQDDSYDDERGTL